MEKIFLILEGVGLGGVLEAFSLRAAGGTIGQGLFVGLAALFLFLYGLSLGKTRAFISLIAIYIAFTFDALFPYLGELHNVTSYPRPLYELRGIIFLLVYIIVVILLNHSFFKGRLTLKEHAFWSVTFLNIIQVGFLTSVFLSFYPEEKIENLVGPIYPYLSSQIAIFIWATLPILILPWFSKKKESSE